MNNEELITKYQILVKKRFNRNISRKKALEDSIKLLRLIEITYKPMTKMDYKKFKNINK